MDTGDDPQDYLLDPELWLDKLPQPFQTIDKVLQEFLNGVWEVIEHRAVIRRREEARVRIPDVTGGQALSGSEGSTLISSHGGASLFLAGPSWLSVLEQDTDSSDGMWRRLASQEWEATPTSITSGESNSVSFVAVTAKLNVRVYAYSKEHLIHLTDLSFADEQDNPPEVTHATVSPTWSHMAVSLSHPDEGKRLQLYRLPLHSWHSEIETHLQQVKGLEGEGSNSRVSIGSRGSKQQEGVVFSSATLLCTLHPPSPLTPCTAVDPAGAMQRVQEDSAPVSCIPTGNLHILSESYLTNRRRAFVKQRADFVQESRDPLTYTTSTPTCHYLYYKSFCKQADPCQVAVWWEGHNQLLVYPIPSNPLKLHPQPVRLLPQTATIVSSASDEEGLHLSLALANGVVSLWNMSTGLCTKLVRAVGDPDTVTAMAFSEGAAHLVVGSEKGKVLVIGTQSQDQAFTSLNHRMSPQKAAYPHLFQHDGYSVESKVVDLKFSPLSLPSVVVSVHASDEVVLWTMTQCEALCRISHTHYLLLGRPYTCAFSKKHLFVISGSTDEEGSTSVFAFNLHTTPTLTPHWSTPSQTSAPSVPPSGMTSSIESYLSQYTKARHAQLETDKERWQRQWTELPQVLNRLSIATQ